jgi:hypothetical protein
MALIATLSAIDANSYVTQEEATAYFTDRMHASTWATLTTIVMDQLLVSSSLMLDWYVKWKGSKATVEQSMQWPREDAIRPDGTEIDDDVLPPEVKIAVYELAFSNLAADRTIDNPLAGIGQLEAGSLMIKAGPEKPNETTPKPVPSHIYKILSDLYNRSSVVRLLRA